MTLDGADMADVDYEIRRAIEPLERDIRQLKRQLEKIQDQQADHEAKLNTILNGNDT